MISKVSSVFDAAVRTVSAALLLSLLPFRIPSSGISGYVAPWQVYGTFPFGSKYNGRGRIQDTKQKPRSSSSVSRAGTLVNPIFCTPDLESYSAT